MRRGAALVLIVAMAACAKSERAAQAPSAAAPTPDEATLDFEPPSVNLPGGATGEPMNQPGDYTTATVPAAMNALEAPPEPEPNGWAFDGKERKKQDGTPAPLQLATKEVEDAQSNRLPHEGLDERPKGVEAARKLPSKSPSPLADGERQLAQIVADPNGSDGFDQGAVATGSTTEALVLGGELAKADDADYAVDMPVEKVVEESKEESEDLEEEREEGESTGKITLHLSDGDKRSAVGGLKRGGRASGEDKGEERPQSFLPRKLYFENTYLGGDAAFQEQMRRLNDSLGEQSLPHTLSLGYTQPFDPPEEAGLSLTAELDHRFLEKEGRVILQVGLQGSLRYGWRRPPLDVVLVLDGPALNEDPEMGVKVAGELLTQLGPQDHLAVVVAGPRPRVLAPLGRIRALRAELALAFDGLGQVPASSDDALAAAMTQAGDLLRAASEDRATLPGTQTVLVVTRGMDGARVQPARAVAHELTLQGMVTSVIETGPGDGLWWAVNDAGYGNYHQVADRDPREAVRSELESLSRVVARLVRINVRLAPGVEAIRILGSRVLDEQEVTKVKAREVAADQHLSRTLGVVADRGDDDDGLQTVIPYFYGGDSHVILIELWVDRPGAVADVTLRYKDMVNLGNATARTSVAVRNLPRDETAEQHAVRRNVRGFRIGEALEHASLRLQRGDLGGARSWVNKARDAARRATPSDRAVVEGFARVLDAGDLSWDTGRRGLVSRSLFVAARRKIGQNRALEQ